MAVLNKIGVITGYEDGRFGPKSLLTRQAAAKIIVSLLIGPEAAQNLTAAVAPYPDVPTSSQFAGYISYCKTANIISGYSDGTFKPEGSLTGYGVYNLPGNDEAVDASTTYAIRSSNSSIQLAGTRYTGEVKPQLRDEGIIEDGKPLINKSIKTIYVSFLDGEVDYIEVKDGVQDVQKTELTNTTDLNLKAGARQAEATLSLSGSELITNSSDVNAIIIKKESNAASLKNLGYVYDYTTTNDKDEDGNIITNYRVLTQDGEDVRMKSTDGVGNRVFVRFTELDNDMYRLKRFGYRIGSGTSAIEGAVLRSTVTKNQKSNTLYLLKMPGVKTMSTTMTSSDDSFIFTSGYPNSTELTVGDAYNGLVNLKGAKILDLRTNVPSKDKIDTLWQFGFTYLQFIFSMPHAFSAKNPPME